MLNIGVMNKEISVYFLHIFIYQEKSMKAAIANKLRCFLPFNHNGTTVGGPINIIGSQVLDYSSILPLESILYLW